MRIVLLARTPKVKVGESITLWLAVRNCGRKPVQIVGRPGWPGRVDLGVRYPGSSGDQVAETRMICVGLPRESEMVNVQPGCFYGEEMVVGRDSKMPYLIEPLRNLRRGRYTFYASYTNDHPTPTGPPFEWGKSNRLTVVVE